MLMCVGRGLIMTFIIVFSRTNLNEFTCVLFEKFTNTPTEQTMQYFVFMFCRYIATFLHVFVK